MTYSNALKFFRSAPEKGSEDAGHVRLLLSAIGNPERKFNILPVTGLKGKSSVVRMLAGITASSGVKAAAVIYPTLHTPKDNIFILGRPLSIDAFLRYTAFLYAAVRSLRLEDPASAQFSRAELLFCLAVHAAAEEGCKWLILEIPPLPFSPLSTIRFSSSITVITSCDQTVGGAITSMIHPGLTETVSARLPFQSSYTAGSSACAKAGCRLTVPVFSGVTVSESSLCRTVFSYRSTEYTMPLYGAFALQNALCAIEAALALRRLGCPITDSGIREGLLHTVLPARAEILSVSPTVLIDAADDAFSISALAALLSEKGTAIGSRITLCLSEDSSVPVSGLSLLEDAGFRLESTVRIPAGKENRTAELLLKSAAAEDLILAVGDLPFVFSMQAEFKKALHFQ